MATPNRLSGGLVSASAIDLPAGGLLIDGVPVTASAAALNAGTGSKATGAEIDTGTNDTKYTTPKAIADSKVVKAIAAGYRIAASAAPVTLDGSNPTSFAHGLATCVAVFVQIVGSTAPGDNTSVLTAVINGANIDVYAWKNTGGTDPTLVASSGTETFNWFAIGT